MRSPSRQPPEPTDQDPPTLNHTRPHSPAIHGSIPHAHSPFSFVSGLDQAPGGIYPHAIYWWRASAIRSSSVASSGSSSARKYASNSACSSPSVGSDGTGLAMGCRSHRVRLRCTCWSRPRRDGWFGMRVWWPRQSWRFLLVVSGTSTPSGSARGSVRPGRGEHVANGRQSRGARPSRRTSAVMSAGIAYPTPPGGRGQFALQEANSHRPPSRRCRGDPRSADQSALCAGPVRPGPPLRGRSGADEPPCGTPGIRIAGDDEPRGHRRGG